MIPSERERSRCGGFLPIMEPRALCLALPEGRVVMYYGFVAMALVLMLTLVALFAAHRVLTVHVDPLTSLPAHSGWLRLESAVSRFDVLLYLAYCISMACDVQMVF